MFLVKNLDDIINLRKNKRVNKYLLYLLEKDYLMMVNSLNYFGINFNLDNIGVYIIYQSGTMWRILNCFGMYNLSDLKIEFVECIAKRHELFFKITGYTPNNFAIVIYISNKEIDSNILEIISSNILLSWEFNR